MSKFTKTVSRRIRERELSKNELDKVVGGIIIDRKATSQKPKKHRSQAFIRKAD